MRTIFLRLRRLIEPRAWISRAARSDLVQW
jgi:hypothetical protein